MKNEDRVKQMIIRSEKILRYCDKQTYDTFTADDMLVEACVFNLSQIGELCHGVTSANIPLHTQIFPGMKCMVCETGSYMIMTA